MDQNDIQQSVEYWCKRSHSNASSHAEANLIVQWVFKWTSKGTINVEPVDKADKGGKNENELN